MRALLLLLLLGLATAAKMPSCEDDTVASCLGDDADMSPEGIDKCLRALPTRSTSCEEYLKIVKECSEDLDSGPCSRARDDGEEMLCLIVRTKPDELSAACQAALPKKEEVKEACPCFAPAVAVRANYPVAHVALRRVRMLRICHQRSVFRW